MGSAKIDAIEAGNLKLSGVPHWGGYLIIVALFLGYLVTANKRDDLVASQRIERCHGLQAESNEALRDLRDALLTNAVACEGVMKHNIEVIRRLEIIDAKLDRIQ